MRQIDNKHSIDGDRIIKTSNNTPIDLDREPVILFRGRDKLALPMLKFYKSLCIADGCNEYQMENLNDVISKFEKFAKESSTMKQSGITRGL